MSLVIDLIDLVAKHKAGELRCPATALIFNELGSVEEQAGQVALDQRQYCPGFLVKRAIF